MDAHHRGHHQRPQNREGNRTSTSSAPIPRRRRRRLPCHDPPIRSSPPNRTRKLREEKRKKTHLPRHRAAFPSLCPPCTWKPIRTHQEQATESRGDEREREIPQNLRPIYLRQQHLASSIRGRFRRLREVSEGSGAPQLTEFARRAGRLRVCQGAPALPTRRGDLAARFRGSG